MLWHLDFFTFGLTTFLSMHLPFESSVDVGRLSRIYDKTVATYKFYWFVSIINLVSTNPDRRVFSFNEIIAGMISEAWYPIHYFRLSFGKQDSLEVNIMEIQRVLNIPIEASKETVRDTILANIDKYNKTHETLSRFHFEYLYSCLL